MAWIIGKKSDESILEISNKRPDFSLQELETIIPQNKGGVSSDYSFLQLSTEEIDKILDGQSYTIKWVSNDLESIDFTLEESKPWAKVSCDKEYILNDGVEEAALTVEIWKTDLSELDTSFQFPNVRIPIKTPNGSKIVRFDIVNGTAIKKFKTTVSGDYVFPGVSKRFNSVRIFNQIAIDVDDKDLLS